MNLIHEIGKINSRKNMNRVAEKIKRDKKSIRELIQIVIDGEKGIADRASWVMRICAENQPDMLNPYVPRLIKHLKKKNIGDPVKRNILGMLQTFIIPEPNTGDLLDSCLSFIQSQKEPVAVKSFALTIAATLARRDPALLNEVRWIVEDQIPYSSPGFKSRIKKAFKDINIE